MAENNPPIVSRSKLLSNNAAEFAETQAGKYFGPEFSQPNGAEFDPDADMFVDQDAVSPLQFEKYYEASKLKCTEFEALLIDFAKMVDERQLQKKFGIKSRGFQEYRAEDVLEIAETVQKKYNNTSKVRECTAVFRKCFASVGRNQGAVSNLLSFIPNDSYGSIIFGGFTLILTAIERAEKLRETAYTALAAIPRKLEFVNNLTHCLRRSIGLYQAADSVFVALFNVLKRIIDEFTRGKGKRTISLLIKGKSYGSDLDAALAALDTKLADFKNEVLLCNSTRLGEMQKSQSRVERGQSRSEEGQSRIESALHLVNEQLTEAKAYIVALQSNSTKSPENEDKIQQMQSGMAANESRKDFLNELYRLLAGSPSLDAYSGDYIGPAAQNYSRPIKPLNERLAREWLEALPLHFHEIATQDIDHYLARSASLSVEDQGKVHYIMTAPQLLEWMNTKKSAVLLIQSELAPREQVNPLSFSSAFCARSLRRTYRCPVLYYSCGSRTMESLEEQKSGPLALINTLNAQLICHLLGKQGNSVDLSFLQEKGLTETSRKSIRSRLKEERGIFDSLLTQLADSDVFVIIDGISRLTGDDILVNKTLRGILRIASKSKTRRIKLIFTDILFRTVLDDYDFLEVFVHSRNESGGQSLNLQFLDDDTRGLLSPGD